MARATGHRQLSEFNIDDLTTFKKDTAELTGVAYGVFLPGNKRAET